LGKVFVFLCMETTPVWESVLGQTIPVNEELERLFRSRVPATRDSRATVSPA